MTLPSRETPAPGRHRFTLVTVGATTFLIFAGGMVTSTGSGLAVPDWPLSYGQLFPPMVGGIFYEHGHRMIAGAVALMTAILTAWTLASEDRREVRWLTLVAMGAVLVQALLGGLTVLLLLPTPISIAHACLGQTFLCLLVALASMTGPVWTERRLGRTPDTGRIPLRHLASAGVAAVFIQLLLGATMRHTGAGLAIPDFPLAFGRLVPPIETFAVGIHFAHRTWGYVVAAILLFLAVRTWRAFGGDVRLRRPAGVLGALVVAQILLGGSILWTERSPVPTSLHVATGAVILATAFALALRLHWRTESAVPANSLRGAE